LIDKGIRVNTVVPGPVETPGLKGLAPSGQEQALLDAQASHVPMGRVGRPEEVAAAVLFLASDESSFMTGTELFVDGGERQL
jgi:NAD(P)-dependent dehydrogenase (short-subunit alcohol dehydrogenase family)